MSRRGLLLTDLEVQSCLKMKQYKNVIGPFYSFCYFLLLYYLLLIYSLFAFGKQVQTFLLLETRLLTYRYKHLNLLQVSKLLISQTNKYAWFIGLWFRIQNISLFINFVSTT